MKGYKKYHQLVKILREHLPLAYPVTVKRVKMKKNDGTCSKSGKKFFIDIDRSLTQQMAIETLLHEYAHALAWSHRHDKMNDEELTRKQHDATWGVAYSEVYRVFEQFYLECYGPETPLKEPLP